jgi:hypothetical protein
VATPDDEQTIGAPQTLFWHALSRPTVFAMVVIT